MELCVCGYVSDVLHQVLIVCVRFVFIIIPYVCYSQHNSIPSVVCV